MSLAVYRAAPWLVGDVASSAGGAIAAAVKSAWPVPAAVALAALVAAAVAIALVYWHESQAVARGWKLLLLLVRTVLIGLVGWMLGGWTIERYRTELPDLVLIVDDSASMSIADQLDDGALTAEIGRRLAALELDGPTRLNLAKVLLLHGDRPLLADLGRRYNVRLYFAGSSARRAGGNRDAIADALRAAQATQPASRLGDCLREVLEAQRGRATAAIVLLSDGVTTDGQPLEDAAQLARRKAIPLFVVGLGSDRPQLDLWLADVQAEEAAFVGDWLHFDVRVAASGFAGEAMVRLARSGEGQPLAEKQVMLAADGSPQPVRLSCRADEVGEFEYVLEVEPKPREVNTENNRLSRKVRVREETIRVLLVQAYPSYEFRFLKQMLARELNAHQPDDQKSTGVNTVLQEADLEYVETDTTALRTFPVSREELFQYDVLIFGDVNPALLSPSIMNNIYEFVTVRGGGLILIAGERFLPLAFAETPLAPLFPFPVEAASLPPPGAAVSASFRPRLTPLGQVSPMMQLAETAAANERLWREELAPLRWLLRIGEVRPGVRVLAEHPDERGERGEPLPVICLQFLGAGKVVFHATDETHRWRFRVGDLYFARYWIQTIRYLCRGALLSSGRLVELTADRTQYRRGDAVNLRARFFDDRLSPPDDRGVFVQLERGGGERRSIALARQALDRGVFEGSAGVLPAGEYRAWIAAPSLEGPPPSVQFTVAQPPGELARQTMDAAALRAAAGAELGKFYSFATASQLPGNLPAGRPARIEPLPPAPLWNAPLVAALFVLLITAEWVIRRRLGML